MKKIIVICIIFSKFIFTSVFSSEKQVFILPPQKEILSLLSAHITYWSEVTLKELSQELAEKTHSKASLNGYLSLRMFGDCKARCQELSNAAEAIAEKSNKETN